MLTYCILSNHFHLLIEVPAKPTKPLSAEELLAKLEALSSTALTAATARQRIQMFRQAKDLAGEREFIDRICATMWDVSGFMQRLKQRFTQWFNRHKGRKGTLWEERFKSVLVEGAGETLATMAAYIDLNPVRAGIVEDPKDYRWCGYGAAVAGNRKAQTGLRVVIAGGERMGEGRHSFPNALAMEKAGRDRTPIGRCGDGGEEKSRVKFRSCVSAASKLQHHFRWRTTIAYRAWWIGSSSSANSSVNSSSATSESMNRSAASGC